MITCEIPGKPIAKKRPRFVRRDNFVKTYNEQETKERKFLTQVISQFEGRRVYMAFRMPRPKSHYGTGRNAGRLKPSAPDFHVSKPDIDNCVKFALDCLNGVVFSDDRQVAELRAIKTYSGYPSTFIMIEEQKR
ncbi:MAG: hypothetical protein CSA11_12010 [Chloroflexi bacterium]|nr:MAG: hypothetical protein CSA11_12010 [Chloroflexota bacterium]